MDESQTKKVSLGPPAAFVIDQDLPHTLMGNIIFRCSKETAGNATNVQVISLVEPPGLSCEICWLGL